ncbi:MAG TPA: isoprenylcysteine carboxyl methyltransferase family protein [bacterium]
MSGFWWLLGFVVCQRLAELWIARRNAAWMKERGAVESGQRHYPLAVALHTAFFVSLTLEVLALHRQPAWWWPAPFALFVLAQALRYWCILTLGRFWNTRILVLPGAPLIRRGPYRLLRHPNYLAVALELLTIPLIFHAYFTALLFSLLNLVFLAIRISREEQALSAGVNNSEFIHLK